MEYSTPKEKDMPFRQLLRKVKHMTPLKDNSLKEAIKELIEIIIKIIKIIMMFM